MSEAKFTPGPWKVCQFGELFEVRSEDGMRVAKTSWHSRIRNPYPLKDEARANVRLIAAAPELLNLAQAIVDADTEGHMFPKWMADSARKAIAAAKGGAS